MRREIQEHEEWKVTVVTLVLIILALLIAMPAHGQEATYSVQLIVPGPFLGLCSTITTENVNGQPVDLSRGAGLSVEECPWTYTDSSNNGGFSFELPPIQPWAPNNDWYGFSVPASQVTRGTPINTSGSLYTEVDTFAGTRTYTYFNLYLHTWSGSIIRHLQKVAHCRYGRCTYSYKDLDNTVNATLVVTLDLTGTVHPVGCHSAYCTPLTPLVYRCGMERAPCFHRVMFHHGEPREF